MAAKFPVLPLVIAAALLAAPAGSGSVVRQAAAQEQDEDGRISIVVPAVDPARGRRLFVTKGCFVCHSVHGVGGMAAPALDADSRSAPVDVLGFAARMWRGAPVMFQLQTMELGYRVELDAGEIGDLAAFVGLASAQDGFSMKEIPEVVRDWIVNEAYWKDPSVDWKERLPERFPELDE